MNGTKVSGFFFSFCNKHERVGYCKRAGRCVAF